MKIEHLDICKDSSRWLAVASGEATLNLSSVRCALRMDYDFKGGLGFVVARRELRHTMPCAFVLRFRLRGRGAVNHLEIKLVDDSGKNVWRQERRDIHLPTRWRETRVADHEFEFAWGPAGGGEITKVGAIEFAIVAGEGGAGSVWISDLRIEDHCLATAPAVSFSSALHPPTSSIEEVANWIPDTTDARPWLAIDLHERRLLGGLIIDWQDHAPPRGFRVRGSNNGTRWKTLRTAKRAGGSRSYVYLPMTTARHLRVELQDRVGIRSLRVQGFEFSRSIEAFWHNIAAQEPRGRHPRWLMREQSLWTPIGALNTKTCALINEEGMIEIDEGSFSVEPFVMVDGVLFTWADVTLRQELRDGWRPVPSVFWCAEDWRMQIEVSASGDGGLHVSYRFQSLTDKIQNIRLHIAIRPFQVTPPWQHFRNVGGVSQIHHLIMRDGVVRVNGDLTIVPGMSDVSFGAMTFDEGLLVNHIATGELPHASEARDASGFASGALVFEVALPPREEKTFGWSTSAASLSDDPWLSKLPEHQLHGASWAKEAIHSMLTATAHILITRSGPALQPGPRRYSRSWIRDGTIMSAALLRMNCDDEVREFIRWYAPHLRDDGFVPCCVDRDGPDWLVEHDSHGQWIALIADYVRFTNDMTLLTEMWPGMARAAAFIEKLIETDGLLPISVSHEGYLAQPVHSYWDDFWAVRALRDAEAMAAMLGHHDQAAHFQEVATRLGDALRSSIEATRAARQLAYIPASVEWADFDPTATANAITLLDLPGELNPNVLVWTFDKYLADWRKKRTGELEWSNYTPYEIRIIGAFVRLGRRDAALELLRFFLSDRRPLAWNQWPEIAWRDPRSPGHIGDVPHTWIAAEYVLAVRSLFAFGSEREQALVLAGGVAPEWIAHSGVQVTAMPTTNGALTYSLRSLADGSLCCEIADGIAVTPGGVLLRPPLESPITRVVINDVEVELTGPYEVRVTELPARVLIYLTPVA